MPKYKGYRRKTRKLLTADEKIGLSRLLQKYEIGQRVIIDIDPSQHKGMPHRRFQGKVGIIKDIRKRSLILDIPIGNKVKTVMVRLEHVNLLRCLAMVEEIYRKPITIHEAKERLKDLEVETVDQIQRRTIDYVSKFAKIDAEIARGIVKRLVEECELTKEEAIELVNVLPSSIEEIRTFTMGWKKLLPTEKLRKILSILHG